MLPELKDLVEKNLFTENEIRHIVKQRTAFETALVRRVAKKADFIRYISYEMDLETLRRKRVKRMDLPKGPATVSDYSFVRRQFHIFERALKRFKSDVGMWIQYIQLAKREGAKALVGRVTARAMQLHPNNPTFYILAASHELDNLSPSAARALLQRGIRANPESVDMWKEYVKMELGFIESLRRRWDVLGIKLDAEKARKGKEKEENDPSPMEDGLEGDVTYESPKMDVDVEDDTGAEGAEARQQIMEGAIVQSVILNAAQALPKIELFTALKTVISDYPSPVALQNTLLDTLFDALAKTLPRDPKGMEMRVHRHLKSSPTAVDFVDGLRAANEEMLAIIGENGEEPLLEMYASFVETWCERVDDHHLKMYLISSLQGLIQKTRKPEPLLAVHIMLLMRTGAAPAKVRRTAEKYTTKAPSSQRVWLARLAVEKEHGPETVEKLWAEARKAVSGSDEEVQDVWTWGLDREGDREAQKRQHEELLRESMQRRGVHEALLVSFVTVLAPDAPETGGKSDQDRWIHWAHSVRHMASRYLTTARVWETVFAQVAKEGTESDGKAAVLEQVYLQWREHDLVAATLGWAQWLAGQGRGGDAAAAVVEGQRRATSPDMSAELSRRWMVVLS